MNTTISVLLVDDDEDDFFLTSSFLNEIKRFTFDIDWKDNYEAASNAIAARDYDVFIFDYYLGSKNAFDLTDIVLANNRNGPIILLTGMENAELDIAAAERGIYDYLEKGKITANALERSIRYSLKQAEVVDALRSSESKYRTVFEQSRDVILILDVDFSIISISQSGTELLNCSKEELLTTTIEDLIYDAETFERLKETILKKGEINNYLLNINTHTKESKTCLVSCKLMNDIGSGKFIHAVVSDQTNRLRAEREAMLNEKMQSTARLMRTLAHEVRNPLTNINLAADSLEAEIQDEYFKLYIDIIKRNAARVDKLITEVLNSARPKEVPDVMQPIEPVIEKAISNVVDRAAFHLINIHTNFRSEGIMIPLNEVNFEIALNNLLVNAIEAMEEVENAALWLSTEVRNNQLIVEIKDNGIGIPPDSLKHLFEPYFTSKNNGIGLGLPATLSIIQSHKGTIDVISEEGKGTLFIISLPFEAMVEADS